ncbi:UTRA domain-containing protein [Sphingomonas sp. CGMCC 1.13654]|uniref:UTRA domain-containing protein n=1 Tax=Sphingomonas chungangi TaxID=2683589 RepID=A0A838L2F9_9SPHN|nr:UTRA domain-containing protein [Sphingomonas chungangi]MBA2932835.1 UTRA domain-containing protein [Sphingomonas chungangi]MVW56456.1 UTRA domain-containing protein [Sphingomonas chungangi]
MSAPLHERIRAGIEAEILSGTLAPGARLPVEHELMRLHSCSRMTVSKALSALASAGLIERRKRAGSFVARPKVHAMVLDVPDLGAEVIGRGQAYAYRLLGRRMRAPRDEEEKLLAGKGRLLQLDGLHLADGMPLALEHRLVALAAAPEMAEADFSAEAPGSWLLHHVPWTEAETRISAVNADDASADLLGLDPGAALLSVERRTWRGGERITSVRQLFVGSAYDLVARFGPS